MDLDAELKMLREKYPAEKIEETGKQRGSQQCKHQAKQSRHSL